MMDSLLDSWLEEAVFIVVDVALSARGRDAESRLWMGRKEPVPGGGGEEKLMRYFFFISKLYFNISSLYVNYQ